MTHVNLTIDGKIVRAKAGEKILWAALDAGIYIPHLCAIREANPPLASCRLCFVEIQGYPSPVTSCSETVKEGMVVRTRTPRVDRLVRNAFELILSVHRLDCKDCPANRNCELQDMAKRLKVKLKQKRHRKTEPDLPVDESRSDFGLDPNHCILCGKCIWVCNELIQCGVLDFARRGLATVVSTFDSKPLAEQADCTGCLKCVEACPAGGLYLKDAKNNE